MPVRKQRTKFPEPGTILRRRYRTRKKLDDRTYEAMVVSVDRGTGWVAVELEGKTYKSLSAAARSITGYQVDGWIFWGLESPRERYTRA